MKTVFHSIIGFLVKKRLFRTLLLGSLFLLVGAKGLGQAPVLTDIELSSLSYTEGDVAVVITSSLTVSDADDTELMSATIAISTGYKSGEDVLSFTNDFGIAGSWDGVMGVLTLNGTSSVTNYQLALRTVTYHNTSDNPTTDNRTVSFKAYDGDIWSEGVTRDINVTGVNDTPVVGNIPDQTIAEGGTFATINLNDYVTDVETADAAILWSYSTLTNLTVSIVGQVATIGVVDGDWNGSELITFTATDQGSLYASDAATFTVTHFVPVWWPRNDMDHMNLYALTAKLDGTDLQPGDEIGIFDGDICVGAGVLTEVLTGSNFLSIIVSRDDPDTPEKDGYTSGNQIMFKIWDASESKEITYTEATYTSGEGIFSKGTTSTFNLSGINPVTQSISLKSGWNILSFTVEPDNLSLRAIVDPLITAGTLIKVQDESGKAIVQLPDPIGWINEIGLMNVSEGYKIKVTTDTDLSISGKPVGSSLDIPLLEGWNIMGYPFNSGQPAFPVFDPLITAGSLIKVQDESGLAIVELPSPIGWIDEIHNLLPGKGYKVKTNINTTLTINNGGKGVFLNDDYATLQATHFKPSYNGNGLDHINLYLKNPAINGVGLKPGDEVGVFDGDLCVGAGIVDNPVQEYLSLIGSSDDPTTKAIDGFIDGHPIKLKAWEKQTGLEMEAQTLSILKGFSRYFEKNGTSVLMADFEKVPNNDLGDAFPNPSHNKTTFTINLISKCSVRLEIFNSLGTLVKVLVDNELPEGIQTIEWDNRTANGYKAEAGVYYYRLRSNGFSKTKSLIIY